MSVVAANGRHEDDIIAESIHHNGVVRVDALLDHAKGILGDPECGYGLGVHAPVNALVALLEQIAVDHPGLLEDTVTMPVDPSVW